MSTCMFKLYPASAGMGRPAMRFAPAGPRASHPFALFLRFASVLKRNALSLMKPEASLWS